MIRIDFNRLRFVIIDDNAHMRRILRTLLHGFGVREVFEAEDGASGLEAFTNQMPDIIITDWAMPIFDGLELTQMIRQPGGNANPFVPIIMQTASASPEEIKEGIKAGAYYYLTKPYDIDTLVAMVTTAARDFGEYKRLRHEITRALGCLTLVETTTLIIRTVAEARDTAAVLSYTCPDPPSAVIGLTELLVNAVEHGNLGITYEEKTVLNANGQWEAEVQRRMALPENQGKIVRFRMERTPSELRFIIVDEGKGFPWQRYLVVEPGRAFDNHGRGIAIARAVSFDSVEYRGTGNEVVATIRLLQPKTAVAR